MDHPSHETLHRFTLGHLPEPDAVEVESHLAGGSGGCCERCLFAARETVPAADAETRQSVEAFVRAVYRQESPADPPEKDDGLDRVLLQAARRRFLLDREAALAPELLRELERQPPAARREAIRTGRRYQLFGLAEALCELSRREGFSDVVRALELAELAVEVADSLDPALYHPKAVADQQALARAFLGNARRVASDLYGAERAFQEALHTVPAGTRSEVVRAEIGGLLGSLRIDQARYDEARRALQDALAVFQAWDEGESVARALLQLGICCGYSRDLPEAVRHFTRAAELLEAQGDDRLLLYARHNVADFLVEAGEPLEALARYDEARPLYDRFAGDPWVALRRRWLEGRIHAALGDSATARTAFDEVLGEAARRELAYELAMASLELAILELDEGNVAAVRRLAADLLPIFRSLELHRHALAAVHLFHHAAHTSTVSASLARDLVRYLQRARNNPYLQFDLPDG
ncbi:MAG: tetratricopeptide repeat protein [Thermoanaerobaculia bacterium]